MYPLQVVNRLWQRANQEPKRLLVWYVLGTKSTPPPDLFKQRLIKQTGKQFGLRVFIETGTYKGDMTAAVRPVFDRVFSIELYKPFYDTAVKRFVADAGVKILYGDSAEQLRELLADVSEPCLFWLDAHGGQAAKDVNGVEGPAPLVAELAVILQHKLIGDHVILVDDVHTFVRDVKWGGGVWSGVEKLREQWMKEHPDWVWVAKDNVLRIHKRGPDVG